MMRTPGDWDDAGAESPVSTDSGPLNLTFPAAVSIRMLIIPGDPQVGHHLTGGTSICLVTDVNIVVQYRTY